MTQTSIAGRDRWRPRAALVAALVAGVLGWSATPAGAHGLTPRQPAGGQLAAAPGDLAGDLAGGTAEADLAWQSTFAGPGLDGTVRAAVVWDDGGGPATYLAGDFQTAGGQQVNRIVRWDGEHWTPLAAAAGTGLNGPVAALAVYDGELVAAGTFTRAGGAQVNYIARWDGTGWTGLTGPGGTGVAGDRSPGVFALAVHDGFLVVGGAFEQAGGLAAENLARWDGQGWSPLPGGGVGHAIVPPVVNALQEHGGALVAAGRFTEAGGVAAAGVARLAGDQWSALGEGVGGMVIPTVWALRVHAGDLVAAGQFPLAGGVEVANVARWDGAAWSPLTGPAGTGVEGTAYALAVLDGELLVGGGFRHAGGVAAGGVARFDGDQWSALAGPSGSGVDAELTPSVSMLFPTDDGLLVGGRFETAGGVVANNLAHWDADGWTLPAGTGGSGLSGSLAGVHAVAHYRGDLVAAGGFTQAGGETAARVARWDGAAWSPLGSGFDNFQVRALAVFDGDLYAGGTFTSAGGHLVNRIARFDGQQWSALGEGDEVGVNGEVVALAVFDGALVLAGSFTQAGALAVDRIARFDGQRFSPLAQGSPGADGQVRALAVAGDELIAAGQFQAIGGQPASRIARFDGQRWRPLAGPDAEGSDAEGLDAEGLDGQVDSLLVHDGAVYAGGTFHHAGAVAADRIARWDGSGWSALGLGTDNAVLAMASFGGDLVAGGVFSRAGGQVVNRIARWDGSEWSALSGPAAAGTDDWVNALLVHPATETAPERLIAGGHFVVTGGVAGWGLGEYGRAAPPPVDPPDDPPVVCDRTVTGVHAGPLTVSEGTTCLAAGAWVLGEVNVAAGAGLVASAAVVQGPISAVSAQRLELSFTQVTGPVLVLGASGPVSLFANQVTGSVSLVDTASNAPPLVAGNTVIGALSCFHNQPAPVHQGLANTATAGKLGQCAQL